MRKMAAVWNPSPGAAKGSKSNEKTERELKRLRFDVKQYDAQLKKLQRELMLRNSELKKLKSCGACTCLGDRRRSRQSQTAEVRDLGTFGPGASRGMAEKARLEIHGQRPATSGDGGRRDKSGERQATPALRRSRTEFFQKGIYDGGAVAESSATLAEKDRELARLHEELAQLRAENSALKDGAANGVQQDRKKDDENARTLRELGRQVRELENELLKLREERYRLLAESELLRSDVNSKETNLLRCETQLSRAEREKADLLEQVRRLEAKERQLSEELNEYRKGGSARKTDGHGSRMHRWNSDLALSRDALVNGDVGVGENLDDSKRTVDSSHRRNGAISGNGFHYESSTRIRDCNPYCEVCRIYRSKLVKHSDRKVGAMNGHVSATTSVKHSDRKVVTTNGPAVTSHSTVMQRELELCVEEQDKQKRLLQRYLGEVQSYERLLAEKDREINESKVTIRDLQRDYEIFRKCQSDKEANLQRLQRELSTANAMKEKAEQSRVALADDYKRLEQQYQKVHQDKTVMQREWELCIEEQDKQKRLVQRHLNEVRTYERLVADKDREISKLKGTIRDLERDYNIFRKNLSEQEANLLRLQRDLSTANAMKEKTEQGRVVLADDYKRLQEQYQKLYQDKAAMQRELELCVEEQDKQKRLLQRYLNEIQSYERLLAEKEKERMDMLLQFQASAERVCKCGNSPPRT